MRRILISLATVLVIVCAAGAQDASDIARRAVSLQQAGQYAEAADAYRSLLKVVPNDVATHVNLGVILVQLGEYDEAIAQYVAADKLLPGDSRIQLNIALAYEKSGRRAEARKRFEALHSKSPGDAQVTMLLADSVLQEGDDQRVLDLLQPLKDSHDLGVSYMLGMALLHLHRENDAQLYLDRILRNGDTAEARFLLGTRMFEAGDYPAAVKQFEKSAELNPDVPGLQQLYGKALLDTGDPDGALVAFHKALSSNGNDFTANLATAQILAARRQFADALPMARQAMARNADSAEAKLVIAQCLLGMNDSKRARPYAEETAKVLPNSPDAHLTLARVYRALQLTALAENENDTADALTRRSDPGPSLSQTAPDFELADVVGKPVRLSAFRGKTPVALVFGSYSCPNFRASAEALKAMQKRHGSRVAFLLVYIREAHATDQWQSTRNAREDLALAAAATMPEKQEHAAVCSRRLHLPFATVVDRMDGAVEAEYNAWPSRAYIIGKDGRIAYSTRLTELDFDPERMEAVLRKVSSSATGSNK